MKFKFKVQPYQTAAVESVVDCFAGQPFASGVSYRIDPGKVAQASALDEGFKNEDIRLTESQVLVNVKDIQRRQNLPVSEKLVESAGCRFNLDVEMETGTGKTYCYTKSIFEMNKRYGWSKFIIMVPSIAIREGIYQSLKNTADHFAETYKKKARFFIYNSKRLHELESFSSDAGINVMIISIQAFNARGADNRRIYDELDDFASRKPIDVISSNRPIIILDEPQKMEGAATMEALPKFKPLMILRYSATHRTQHNRVHRLDALDAYNQRLVKKIQVRGIQARGLAGTNAYLYLEGIENPNVFVMCMLKHSDNNISRRQEVGRGLRLCVDHNGDRVDNPATVHDVNVLTVVASESYQSFVAALQQEIAAALSARPRKATEAYFTGKVLAADGGAVEITPQMAKQIYRYLVKNDYTDDTDSISQTYHQARDADALAGFSEELAPYAAQIIDLIDSVFDDSKLPKIDNGRTPKTNLLNDNFSKQAFQELWSRINRKAVFKVEFDSAELVRKAVSTLDSHLRVTPLQYKVQVGSQGESVTDAELKAGEGFKLTSTTTEQGGAIYSDVSYDLLGRVAEDTQLTRKTLADILTGIQPATFDQFKLNPEHFISEAGRLINEQKATAIIEKLEYDEVAERYETNIFTAAQTGQDFSRATAKLKNHIYDYCMVDSEVERSFVTELDTSEEVVVYAKLPRGFLIPTPVGDYNPDWAISFKRGKVRHIYFVAETKGTMSSMKLREIEKTKIECARRFFAEIGKRVDADKVRYDVITFYSQLMAVVH
ncbi:MAG: DEAD/DEAH box helicase family protein [Devosia sp.]